MRLKKSKSQNMRSRTTLFQGDIEGLDSEINAGTGDGYASPGEGEGDENVNASDAAAAAAAAIHREYVDGYNQPIIEAFESMLDNAPML